MRRKRFRFADLISGSTPKALRFCACVSQPQAAALLVFVGMVAIYDIYPQGVYYKGKRNLSTGQAAANVPARDEELFFVKKGIEISKYFRAGPILRANHFSLEAALTIDDVRFGVHGSPIRARDAVGWIKVGGKGNLKRPQKILVRGLIFLLARIDAQHGATERRDMVLQLIERRSFLNTRLAPGGPEIQDYNFALQVRQMCRFAVESELKIVGGAATKTWFALAVVRANEEHHKRGDKRENDACF
jgi:hypothetical protein